MIGPWNWLTKSRCLVTSTNAKFTRLGATTKFFRDKEKYLVNTEGPDGELHDYEIKYTFGIQAVAAVYD